MNGKIRNHSTTATPGVSSITYSGYLYKRSNYPHRNPNEFKQQQYNEATADETYVNGSIIPPELPIIPGMFLNVGVSSVEKGTELVSQQNNYGSPLSPPLLSTNQTKAINNEEKNPIQLGLESAAAFFGIELIANRKKNHNNKSINSNYCINDGVLNDNKEKIRNENGKAQAMLPSQTTYHKKSSAPIKVVMNSNAITSLTTGTARIPIPPSPSREQRINSSFYEAVHRRHSAPSTASDHSCSSQQLDSSNSFGSKHNCEVSIPQDFYDPNDGHLWRAKYCVLEDSILYFYRNANDGNSLEAMSERKSDTCGPLLDDCVHFTRNDDNGSTGGSFINNRSSISTKINHADTTIKVRRRGSAQDLSKSPMIRPGMIHNLDNSDISSSDIGTCIWEKRVYMDCVGGVRTAEQQFGYNSFELLAMEDDDDYDHNLTDTLVLKAPNPIEMKEWIFQFHRSLASFMRSIIDVVGSTSSSGAFSYIHHPSTMQSLSHSNRPSSTNLLSPGLIPQSFSEKQLHRLISVSPSLQQPLSHGHGRTTLKRRIGIKRTMSEGISLSSTPETGGTGYSTQHPFALDPSPNNLGTSPDSISSPSRFMIPPPLNSNKVQGINKGYLESVMTNTIKLPLNSADSEFHNLCLNNTEAEQLKPPARKYIPPHLRSTESKYIPPHLRRRQEEPEKIDVTINIPPTVRKSSKKTHDIQEIMQHSHYLTPLPPTPTEQCLSDTVPVGELDVVDDSTSDFIRGGCADPQLIRGSILDDEYIPKKASRLEKTRAEAYGSLGGDFYDTDMKSSKSPLRWEAGAISECGIRESNEDAYLITNDLLHLFQSGSYGSLPQTYWKEQDTDHSVGLFAIFDGHCGNQAARFAVEKLGRFIHHELLVESNNCENNSHTSASSLHPLSVESILREAIIKLDDEFCNLCQQNGREWESGATALVAMVANENLVIASLGDCRGILCRFVDSTMLYESDDDDEWCQLDTELDDIGQFPSDTNDGREDMQRCFWREVTTVHSPSVRDERERIEKANGWITTETEIPIGQLRRMDFQDEDVVDILKRCLNHPSGNGSTSFAGSDRSVKECKAAPQRIIHISRVCGELAVSRALGDRDFKAIFNTLPTQEGDNLKINSQHEHNGDDTSWWESSLFLPYPDNHNGRFRGDLVKNIPDFHKVKLEKEAAVKEFLLLACDGLWDVLDVDEAIRVVRDLLFRKKFTAKKAASRLAELAIRLGSSDNITVILVRFFSTKDEDTNK